MSALGYKSRELTLTHHALRFRALVRPGRFDRHIAVPLPDVRGRVQILKHHMKDVVTAPSAHLLISFPLKRPSHAHILLTPQMWTRWSSRAAPRASLARICRTWSSKCPGVTAQSQTAHYTYVLPFLVFLHSQAAVQAARDGATAVQLQHFEWAKVRHTHTHINEAQLTADPSFVLWRRTAS